MLYITCNDLIPESRGASHGGRGSTIGLIAGIIAGYSDNFSRLRTQEDGSFVFFAFHPHVCLRRKIELETKVYRIRRDDIEKRIFGQ